MSLTFEISLKPELIGKADLGAQLGVWLSREMTPRELAHWAFFEHRGYCHGVFDNEEFTRNPQGYKTARANVFLRFAEVVTVDIDSGSFSKEPFLEKRDDLLAAARLERLLENEFVRKHCFLITPSSGNKLPEKPNYHLHFKLNRRITSPDEYRAIALAVAAMIDVPTDHQTAKAAQLTAGTLFKDPTRHDAGYSWDDLYVNDDAEEVDPDTVTSVRPVFAHASLAIDWAQKRAQRAANYQETESGNERAQRHLRQPMPERERLVIECLSYVLPTCSDQTTYDQWLQIWTSAHHGAPTDAVRDFIINHPSPVWSDGDNGKRKFYHAWAMHQRRDDGYTVASLIYLAVKAGWLSKTGYEIAEFLADKIDVDHIRDWLDTEEVVPDRLILESQTGSGKTETLINLWHRLGQPKSVVFVPTVKLATELAGKLEKAGLPVTLYIETDTGRRLSYNQLITADVLVTTLQTFAIKAFRAGGVMKDYGLVYVEESDQLISQFARGGGSSLYQGSHVTDEQARKGFSVLEEALRDSGHVWFVDATMTQVTHRMAEALSDRPVRYVLNTRVRPKATVRMVETLEEGYRVILEALRQGKRVVAACDKRERAREIIDAMRAIGVLDRRSWLLITRDTEHELPVKAFMEDVEASAAKYDLVAYNSVMASGVSITKTTPDVVVQFCEYLTPRSNLQILNRYRSQKTVYCYYADTESLYKRTADQIYERAGHRLELESRILHMPVVERDDLTKLRATLATISASDDELQRRAPRDFYRSLLHGDGRKVVETEAAPSDMPLKHTLAEVRKVNKERKEYVRAHWHEEAPIDVDHPATPEQSSLQVACGRYHAHIRDMLNGVVPVGVDPAHIAEVCDQFAGKEFFLATLAHQERAISRAEQYLADRGRAITAVATNATLLATLMTVRQLFHRLDEVLTEDVVEERAPRFLRELAQYQPHYDAIFDRGRYKYEVMTEKYADDRGKLALAFAKVIFAKLGLVLKSEQKDRVGSAERQKQGKPAWRNEYYIENLEAAQSFLTWKFRQKEGEEPVSLTSAWEGDAFQREIDSNAIAMSDMNLMTPDEKLHLLKMLTEEISESRFRELVVATREGSWA